MALGCLFKHAVQSQHVMLICEKTICSGLQALLAGIMGQLEAMLDVLAAQGFEPLQAAYLDAWLHSGQQVLTCITTLARHVPEDVNVLWVKP